MQSIPLHCSSVREHRNISSVVPVTWIHWNGKPKYLKDLWTVIMLIFIGLVEKMHEIQKSILSQFFEFTSRNILGMLLIVHQHQLHEKQKRTMHVIVLIERWHTVKPLYSHGLVFGHNEHLLANGSRCFVSLYASPSKR